MKFTNKIFVTLFLIMSTFSFSQVSVTTTGCSITPGNSVADCGTIDLGSNDSVNVQFTINLSKSHSQVVGQGYLYVYYQRSSAYFRGLLSTKIIQEISWTQPGGNYPDTYTSTGNVTLDSYNFDVSGGTLFVVFKSSSNVEYTSSCPYSIIKNPEPTFTFSPTSLSLACGDMSSQTFTVTPANIPSGANVAYQWSYSGWSGTVNPSMNSVTLTPISGTSLPSNVSVKPYVNNSGYPLKTCTVSRSSITPTGYISGSATVCTTRTFTFTGLLAGQTVAWSLSNATAGTLNPPNGASTTFTTTGGGSVYLTATISNSCGESYVKGLDLFAGSPPAFAMSHDLYENQYCDTKYHQVPFIFKIPAGSSLSILYKYPNASYTVTSLGNNEYRYTFAFSKSYSGYFDLMANITNSCGSSYFETEGEYYIQSCTQIGANSNQLQDNLENKFTVFPNPANDIVTIELKDSEKQFEEDVTISGELFDMLGQSKSKIKNSDNKATFSVKGLKKGIYILKILINDQVESHRIAVE